MLINLVDYYILSKISLGTTLTITFQNNIDIHDRRVLEFKEIVGFIEQSTNGKLKSLRIDNGGNSYAHDLSLRLKRPEIMNFSEAFLFTDEQVSFQFRACAKAINFREWMETDIWLK